MVVSKQESLKCTRHRKTTTHPHPVTAVYSSPVLALSLGASPPQIPFSTVCYSIRHNVGCKPPRPRASFFFCQSSVQLQCSLTNHIGAHVQSKTNVLDPKPPISPPTPPARFDQARQIISQPFTAAFCAGGVAGAVSRTVVSPLERLKILFQIQSAGRDEYKLSVGKALKKMWREEGWRGFMRGNGTNCIRIVPYSAVQFGSYNFYKRVRLCALIPDDAQGCSCASADLSC